MRCNASERAHQAQEVRLRKISRNERIVYLKADGVTLEYKVRSNKSKASLEAEAKAWLQQKHPTVNPASLELGFFPAFPQEG